MANDSFDMVTLAQLEKGDVRLYEVRFTDSAHAKRGQRPYVYKTHLTFNPGEKAAYRLYGVTAPADGGEFGKVVEIVREVKHVEPGTRYNWIVGKVTDFVRSNVLTERDDEMRQMLAMIRAKAEMRMFTEELKTFNLLPDLSAPANPVIDDGEEDA